jgi:hypothetical protein
MTLRGPKPLMVGDLRRWLVDIDPDTRVEIVDQDGIELPISAAEAHEGEGGDYLRFTVWADGEIVIGRRKRA